MDDSSFIEFDDDALYRSSGESSEGFSFTSAMELRKNLTETFEKQVNTSGTVPVAKLSTLSTTSSSTAFSVVDRIAQFEQAAKHAKPPLPNRASNNVIPSNRVAVYLRIRPPTASEQKKKSNAGDVNTIEVLKPKHPNIHPTIVRTYPPAQSHANRIHLNREGQDDCAKEFEFHQVLEQATTQKTLYGTVASPLIDGLFEAITEKKSSIESALLFSYGITNAGKTYTMLGNIKENSEAKWGVIPRAISDMFDRMKNLPKVYGHHDLYISYFEIYNEQIFDLVPKKSGKKNVGPPTALKVRERNGETIVRGLARHKVRDTKHGIELTTAANKRRHTSSNNLNTGSSRSHCVCQLKLVPRSSVAHGISKVSDDDSVISMSGYSTDEEAAMLSRPRSSTLWIVDLAGSERSKRAGTGSDRQKEASQINKSLMTLMRCLTVMREAGKNPSSGVVPFRESKLTHVFMSHLTGPSAARTAMVVNVNPSIADFDETQHVLSYASQAKMIQMDPAEMSKKRKQYFGDEYGLDGRKKSRAIASAANATRKLVSKVAKKLSPKKIAKKLSPKKIAKKLSPKKMFRGKDEKSKKTSTTAAAATTARDPVRKLTKYPSSNFALGSNAKSQEKEIKSLRLALNVAQGEIEVLTTEKEKLVEKLEQQEAEIRMEVAEEMEERLRAARERNSEELQRLRSQLSANPPICRSTRKLQQDRAEQQIEELVDKVNECEEEMTRMRDQHQNEVAALKAQLDEKAQAGNAPATNFAYYERKIADLEKELQASRTHVERLETSKVELVENYEKLLREGDDEDEDEDVDEGSNRDAESFDDTENQVPSWKRKLLGKQRNQPQPLVQRKPLQSISGNVSESGSKADMDWDKSLKRERWLFPKNPSSQEDNGSYRRPSGRAPQGREWDASVGAWRLAAR